VETVFTFTHSVYVILMILVV